MTLEELKKFFLQQKQVKEVILSNDNKRLDVKFYAPKLKGIKTSQHMQGKSIDIDAGSVEENKKIENKY
jgi:hypothetical protein